MVGRQAFGVPPITENYFAATAAAFSDPVGGGQLVKKVINKKKCTCGHVSKDSDTGCK